MRSLLLITSIISIIFLVSCVKDTTNVDEKNTHVVTEDSGKDSVLNTEISPSTEQNERQNSPDYLAKNESVLSESDIETAYEMCVNALTDYYKAVWNGTNIELDAFIENDNLKQYTLKKILSQYDVYKNVTENSVQDIVIGAWEAEFTNNEDGGFLYLKLPVEIIKSVGSYGEVTEFLVRNVNGKLVIVDWYTGAKDSYDFLTRGENLTIDNPKVWDKSE
ncbi:hypothetical protein NDK47_19080 [Brevibacillus ruminantium]|uniref:Lipoprotein n=1 Tax=Brevibacillus ruminantium TaxID=2950604 RepID=A0ABY4WBX7_9BACL|nr:hypothetical protein [Brevibacillus ruminantium]USG64244.1 hypothetical protein NDK47_19080 [Brevibacillus ruminantium]